MAEKTPPLRGLNFIIPPCPVKGRAGKGFYFTELQKALKPSDGLV